MPPVKHDDARAIERAGKVIAEGQTLLVAVDSNAFFEGTGAGRKVNFSQAWMGRFRQLAARGEKLLLSVVWDEEVRRHFKNSIDDQVQIKLPKFVKTASNKQAIEELTSHAQALRINAQELLNQEWVSVKGSLGAELIEVPDRSGLAREILDLWAKAHWPFEGRKEKRNEFQDAFALLSLRAYVEDFRARDPQTNATVLVVTQDVGCRKFCEQTDTLIPCADIAVAMNFLDRRDEIVRLSNRSKDMSECFLDAAHPLFIELKDELNKGLGVFPPREFEFLQGGRMRSGWHHALAINAVRLLPTGPKGSLIEVANDQGAYLEIRGRATFEITITLNEPYYVEGSAMPSSEMVISDCRCSVEADFRAAYGKVHWHANLIDFPKRLMSISGGGELN